MKHQDGKSICAHVLDLKLHIDRLGMLGVMFPRKLAIDLVLQSLPKSYSELVKGYYMTDRDMSLIDLTYLLVATESTMILRTGNANFIGRSTSQTSMDIDNGNIGSPEKISLSKGKGKAKSEIVLCTIPKESIYFYCHEKGNWLRSGRIYLKDHKNGEIKRFESSSERRKLKGNGKAEFDRE
ncbi:hypothetical protein Lser_V15G04127 [Lactuca serriola]